MSVKTVPLKLSEYLDKNAFYNYEEQLIGFSLNSCTRTCNSANNPRQYCREYLILNMEVLCPPCTNVSSFLDAQPDRYNTAKLVSLHWQSTGT